MSVCERAKEIEAVCSGSCPALYYVVAGVSFVACVCEGTTVRMRLIEESIKNK